MMLGYGHALIMGDMNTGLWNEMKLWNEIMNEIIDD